MATQRLLTAVAIARVVMKLGSRVDVPSHTKTTHRTLKPYYLHRDNGSTLVARFTCGSSNLKALTVMRCLGNILHWGLKASAGTQTHVPLMRGRKSGYDEILYMRRKNTHFGLSLKLHYHE
ncbi:uncharacterized protein MELLADRAFT_114580 [Melampsora larici-populina 98AG31]|uniref:Uncharacterized protein n=1 Tax=Melampsora larici-populina (strain 98AG31 / pathotype 3-4-7) TaxID=747676 RepID=F4SE08_MELLP|nr:uncharacterized protein MELLADRAFT_114580 [Melampsora larici-populina 98AG31]EGF97118.1 hypothetical protein MELLADRAFT_114580 [Melampsora larici-populina 98AG31]